MGDPMRPLMWVSKSQEKLADELVALGHDVSPNTVGRLLVDELDGNDLRGLPIETRRATLASLLRHPGAVRFSEHISANGPEVFAHACKLGAEGIVSKRLGSPY